MNKCKLNEKDANCKNNKNGFCLVKSKIVKCGLWDEFYKHSQKKQGKSSYRRDTASILESEATHSSLKGLPDNSDSKK